MFALTRRLTLRPLWPEETGALARIATPTAGADPLCVIVTRDGGSPRIIGATWLFAERLEHMLGIAIAPEARRRGYATEAARAMLDIAQYGLGLRRLTARIVPGDAAGHRLLATLGFRDGAAGQMLALGEPAAVEARTGFRPFLPPIGVAA